MIAPLGTADKVETTSGEVFESGEKSRSPHGRTCSVCRWKRPGLLVFRPRPEPYERRAKSGAGTQARPTARLSMGRSVVDEGEISMSDGVKASMILWTEPPMYVKGDRWHGPPGAFIQKQGINGTNWTLCCPSCGELGTPREGATWEIKTGSFDDVTGLSLWPSIAKSCCGWHGYLQNGVFVLQWKSDE